jgi:hypothetical protein
MYQPANLKRAWAVLRGRSKENPRRSGALCACRLVIPKFR